MDKRAATAIRLGGLALVAWSVISARHGPGLTGRGLVVSVCLALAALAWLLWTARSLDASPLLDGRSLGETWLMATAGAVLTAASPSSAASAFVFVAVVNASLRTELRRGLPVAAAGALTLAISALLYDDSALGVLAYALGFAAVTLAASNSRSSAVRAEQAELLLAQAQRSHEEQLRTARLEQATRLAREVHDVLAHTLAGLTIQLEATGALLEQGADRGALLARVRQAHELARQGLVETRRAVGALRGETDAREFPLAAGLEALIEAHRAASSARAELSIEGDPERLQLDVREALVRVAQEALTNVRKHAPGADVEVRLQAGSDQRDPVLLAVSNRAQPGAEQPSSLSSSGGGYGVAGMRERAHELGGALAAAATDDGWQVELRLPAGAERVRSGVQEPVR